MIQELHVTGEDLAHSAFFALLVLKRAALQTSFEEEWIALLNVGARRLGKRVPADGRVILGVFLAADLAIGRVAHQARMVLLSARGYSVPQIAVIIEVGGDYGHSWLQRYQ